MKLNDLSWIIIIVFTAGGGSIKHCIQAQNVPGQVVLCHCYCGINIRPPCGDAECIEHCTHGQSSMSGSSPSDFRLQIIQTAIPLILNSFKNDLKRQWNALEDQRRELERIAIENQRQQRIKDSIAQVLYEHLMALYKQLPGQQLNVKSLPGSQPLNLKTLDGNNTLLGFKNFDGDNSGYMYKDVDVKPNPIVKDTSWSSHLTTTEIQLLINPENDPLIIDIGSTNQYLNHYMNSDTLKNQAPKLNNPQTTEELKYLAPNCDVLREKYNGFVRERARLQKTMDLTQNELKEWTENNNKALWNSFTDGAEFFVDKLLDHVEKSRKSSSDIMEYLIRNETKLRNRGINIDAYTSLYKNKIRNYDVARISKMVLKGKDWANIIMDESQAIAELFAQNNQEVKALLNNPEFKKFLNEDPAGPEAAKSVIEEAADILYIEAEDMTKWFTAAFCSQAKKVYPVIALADLSIKEIYNGMDWILSYNRIIQNRDINGSELYAAVKLEKTIDETTELLKNCR